MGGEVRAVIGGVVNRRRRGKRRREQERDDMRKNRSCNIGRR